MKKFYGLVYMIEIAFKINKKYLMQKTLSFCHLSAVKASGYMHSIQGSVIQVICHVS
jgi:hypothetical protein